MNPALFLFTWHTHMGSDPATFSAVAKTKEEAICYIMQRLESSRAFASDKEKFDWRFPFNAQKRANELAAFYAMQHKAVPNTLLVQGSYCPDFHTVLENFDEDSETNKSFLDFLMLTEPTECQPMVEGFVVMTSNLSG